MFVINNQNFSSTNILKAASLSLWQATHSLLVLLQLLPDVLLDLLGRPVALDVKLRERHVLRPWHRRVLRELGVFAVRHWSIGAPHAVDASAAPRGSDLWVSGERDLSAALVVGQALGDTPTELGVVIDLHLLELLQVAPLPGNGAGELVLFDVDFNQVRHAGHPHGQLANQVVRVEVDLGQVGEVLEFLWNRTLQPAVREVEVGDLLAVALGGILPGPVAPLVVANPVPSALETFPVSVVPVASARVVGARQARLSRAIPALQRALPPCGFVGVLLPEQDGRPDVFLARGRVLRVREDVLMQQASKGAEAHDHQVARSHHCQTVRANAPSSSLTLSFLRRRRVRRLVRTTDVEHPHQQQ
mmetsp:Transcript_1667/g.3712  ORF Transcript_1667/g.3712 Transcript_1667/m.3712 type:complete len:360 (-) Transcript_1667:255-1334(-)